MTEVEWIITEISENASNYCFLETLTMWTSNPSSKSAGYGKEQFWKAVAENLSYRYSNEELKKGVSLARSLISFALNEIEYDQLNHLLEETIAKFGESDLHNILIDLMVKESELRNHIFILAKYFDENDMWEYFLSGGNKKSINARLEREFSRRPKYDFNDFIELGFLYKLPWVKTGIGSGVSTEYVLPSHAAMALQILLEDPSLDVPYSCEYCEEEFETHESLIRHVSDDCRRGEVEDTIFSNQVIYAETESTTPICLDCHGIKLIKRGHGSKDGCDILDAIIQSADRYIRLEDNFLSVSTIKRLLSSKDSVRIEILTSLYEEKKDKNRKNVHKIKPLARFLSSLDLPKDRLEIKETGGPWTHDRVLLTEKQGWMFTTSLSDIIDDEKWSLVCHLPGDAKEYIETDFVDLWDESQLVTPSTYWKLFRRGSGLSRREIIETG